MPTEKDETLRELKVVQIEKELESTFKLYWKLENICIDYADMDLETFIAYRKRVMEDAKIFKVKEWKNKSKTLYAKDNKEFIEKYDKG